MFVITEKETEAILFMDPAKTRMIVCRNEPAAIQAVEKLNELAQAKKLGELAKKGFSYTKLDTKMSSRLWYLENEQGKKYDLEPGIRVAFRNKKSAWGYSGSVWHQTSNILQPVRA